MPYTPQQRTFAWLSSEAESRFADNTNREISEQDLREYLMDFAYTVQVLGSQQITDTDGDTYFRVEQGADDDTLRMAAGGNIYLNMAPDGSNPWPVGYIGITDRVKMEWVAGGSVGRLNYGDQVGLRWGSDRVAELGDSNSGVSGNGTHVQVDDTNRRITLDGSNVRFQNSDFTTGASPISGSALYLDTDGFLKSAQIEPIYIESTADNARLSALSNQILGVVGGRQMINLQFTSGNTLAEIGDVSASGNGAKVTVDDANNRVLLTADEVRFSAITPSTDNGDTSKALYVGANGEILYGDITGAGGGAATLGALNDVTTTNKTLADGDALLYNTGNSLWQATQTVNVYDAANHPTGGDATLLQANGNWDANNIYTGSALSGTYLAGIRWFDGVYLYEYTGSNWHRVAKTDTGGSGVANSVLVYNEDATPALVGAMFYDAGTNAVSLLVGGWNFAHDLDGSVGVLTASNYATFSWDDTTPGSFLWNWNVGDAGIELQQDGGIVQIDGTMRILEARASEIATPADATTGQRFLTFDPTTGNATVVAFPSVSGGGASSFNDLSDAYTNGTNSITTLSPNGADGSALATASKTRMTIIGEFAGRNITSNISSNEEMNTVLVGPFAGDGMDDSYRNVAVGGAAGINYDGNNSILIGWEAGSGVTGDSNVLIGGRASRNVDVSSTFLVQVSGTEFIRIQPTASPVVVRIPTLPGYADQTAAAAALSTNDLFYNTTTGGVDQVR